MTRKLQLLLTTLLLTIVGVTGAWAGDFIDDANTITISQNLTPLTANVNTEGGKKVLSFTSCDVAEKEFHLEFAFESKSIKPGQVFGVAEFSANYKTNGNHRIRNLKNGDTKYEDNNGSVVTITLANGNTLVLMSCLAGTSQVANEKGLINLYKSNVDNESFSITYADAYFHSVAASTTTTINRLGMYTLGEIITLYPELKTKNWEIYTYSLDGSSKRVNDFRLLNEGAGNTVSGSQNNNGTDNGWIETHKNGISFTDLAECKLFIKAVDVDNLPSNYTTFFYSKFNPSTAANTDLFSNIPTAATLKMPKEYMHMMPTMHQKLDDSADNKFYRFLDDVAPNSVSATHNSGQNWAVYSRELKAGYNSCVLPFKKLAGETYMPSGITLYKASSLTDGKIVFEKISDCWTNNTFTDGSSSWTPMIIKAETAGVCTFVGRDAIESVTGYKSKTVGSSDNKIFFVGSFVNEVPSGDYTSTTNYGISTDGKKFLKMIADTKTTYYRAFLADSDPGARALTLSFEDETTGISETMSAKHVFGEGEYFDLSGRRVAQPTKGLYIMNGKKVVIK